MIQDNPGNKSSQIMGRISSKIKAFVLVFFGILSAAVFGWSLSALINDDLWNYLVVAIVSGILFCAVYLYQAIFITNGKVLALAVIFEGVAILWFFIGFGWAAVSVFVVVCLLLLTGNVDAKSWMENTVKIKFRHLASPLLSRVMIALFLVPSVFVPLDLKRSENEFPVSKDIFEAAVDSSRRVMGVFIPGIDFNMSVEEATKKIMDDRIKVNEQIKELSTPAKEQIIEQVQNDMISQFSSWIGITVDSRQSISQNLYDGLQAKFSAQPPQIKTTIFVLVGALIFLSLSGLLWPIRVVVLMISWIGYELLISFGFANIIYETRMKETITLD